VAILLNSLNFIFRAKVEELLASCRLQGIEMRPYAALRTPLEQARLWRQSRSVEEIVAKIHQLRAAGAHFLAACLEKVGPQHGRPVTNAIPGFSWHQWGEAVDCFWLVEETALWSAQKLVNGVNGYRVYAQIATQLGLTAGGGWTSPKDWPHVQWQSAKSPGQLYPLIQIDETMRELFGEGHE